jgi:predicted esterase
MRAGLLLGVLSIVAYSEELPPGRIIDDVKCSADPSQTYALYLPSHYSANRAWAVIFALDPGARGRLPVTRFQPGAENYGYIVAGSNNSRNGSWEMSLAAVQAMVADVTQRFAIDRKQMYLAGFSGGARVAMQVALSTSQIAGVIASSAGFPDSTPRKSVPFAIFATAGTEDFNYLEMRRLDRALTTPHHLAIFEGGHGWPPSNLAEEAIEWLETQAMKSGRRPSDQAILDGAFARRVAQANSQTSEFATTRAVQALIDDFEGLRDVTKFAARVAALQRNKSVKQAGKKELELEQREEHFLIDLVALEAQLANPAARNASLSSLRSRLADLTHQANAAEDSSERRLARRLLRGAIVRSIELHKDPEYRRLLDELPIAGRPGG